MQLADRTKTNELSILSKPVGSIPGISCPALITLVFSETGE